MYIDFHYYMIKVLAAKAGFPLEEAEDIAYASEFVDDALEFMRMRIRHLPEVASPLVQEDLFDVVCAAHDEDSMMGGALVTGQERTYMPFHFIPRDRKGDPGVDKSNFDYRSAPDCRLARELVVRAIDELKACPDQRVRKLIKLGIALHTYADTWAHRDFSALFSEDQNSVANLEVFRDGKWVAVTVPDQVAVVPSTGHAKAYAFPDSSHLVFRYHNGTTREYFEHNNPEAYLEAAETIYGLLCQATGSQNAWMSIRDRVEDCIRYVPCDDIWVKEGLDDKISRYLKKFGEVFLKNPSAPVSAPFAIDDYHVFDRTRWKRDALVPYRKEADGTRTELSFDCDELDMRRIAKKPKEALQQFIGEKKYKDMEWYHWVAYAASNRLADDLQVLAKRIYQSIEQWRKDLQSIEYDFKGDGIQSLKWLYFNLEAADQRKFVLERVYPINEDFAQSIEGGLFDVLSPETLQPQFMAMARNAIDKWVSHPPQELKEKALWMEMTLRNRTPYTIVWTGDPAHDHDMGSTVTWGRYWDRPDKRGPLLPGGEMTFSVCNRDNDPRGIGGVAPFSLVTPAGDRHPFTIAFSQSSADAVLRRIKQEISDIGVDLVNTGAQVADQISRWFGWSVDDRLAKSAVEPLPKCHVDFGAFSLDPWNKLDGSAEEFNKVTKDAGPHAIVLTCKPGRKSEIDISCSAPYVLAQRLVVGDGGESCPLVAISGGHAAALASFRKSGRKVVLGWPGAGKAERQLDWGAFEGRPIKEVAVAQVGHHDHFVAVCEDGSLIHHVYGESGETIKSELQAPALPRLAGVALTQGRDGEAAQAFFVDIRGDVWVSGLAAHTALLSESGRHRHAPPVKAVRVYAGYSDRPELLLVGVDGKLYAAGVDTTGTLSPITAWGHQAVADIKHIAVRSSGGVLNVFAIDGKGALHHCRGRSSGTWSDWVRMTEGPIRETSVAISPEGDHVELFALGQDRVLHHNWSKDHGANWQGWQERPWKAPLLDSICAAREEDYIHVFAVDSASKRIVHNCSGSTGGWKGAWMPL